MPGLHFSKRKTYPTFSTVSLLAILTWFADINLRLTSLHTVQEQAFLSMAVPLMRNAFAEKRTDLFAVLSKRFENVLFTFFLHKTSKRYSCRKIFAVLSIILSLPKKGTEFLGNDHYHHLIIIMSGSSGRSIIIISPSLLSSHKHLHHYHYDHHHNHYKTIFLIIIIIVVVVVVIVITTVWNKTMLKKRWSICQIQWDIIVILFHNLQKRSSCKKRAKF